jgi:uncharacterized membrane protein YdfJ with MMPL/SSD domain
LTGEPGVLGVTGSGPGQADFSDAVYGRPPLMLLVVSILTFLLLARAFRSLVLPTKAVLLNLVSLGAAYGVLVLVWQDGHGSMTVWSERTGPGSFSGPGSPFQPTGATTERHREDRYPAAITPADRRYTTGPRRPATSV